MEVKYTDCDFIDLIQDLQRELSIMFVSTGIDALINISSPYFHEEGFRCLSWQRVKYPDDLKDGIWVLAIDIREYKTLSGEEVKPNISKSDISCSGYIRNRDILSFSQKFLSQNKQRICERWFNTTWTGGRIVLIIFRDGTIKQVPTEYVSYAQQIEKCTGVAKVVSLIRDLCSHPFTRSSRRNNEIKWELFEKTKYSFLADF